MKYFSWIYIFLYASYVILGPHYIARTIRGDTLEIVDTPMTLASRIFFLSYIAYLASAYFFFYPNGLTWLIAIVINATAIIGYIVRWFPIRNVDPYYWTGLVAHILVIIPLFLGLKFYKIDIIRRIFTLKRDQYLSLIITGALLILYFIIQNNIYRDEKWKDYLEPQKKQI